jgi:TP901 family phage tail tape measure protein
MLQLAKGGLTLKEAMAATRGTLQLAAAAQTDVATASNETARALTTFNLSGSHAGEIADLLANGAASATGDIQDFALALSQSGTSAHQFGLTAQDTVTAITELAKSGILGSDAGTSLRVMLTRLLPTSKAAQREIKRLGIEVTDASGHFLPFRDIVQQYSTALGKLSPAQRQFALQTIFGTDAQRAANIILGHGVKEFDNLSAAVSKQGGAAARAAAQQKGFKGALDGFNSALQTTEVTVGTQLLPVLTKYLRELAKWLGQSKNQQKVQKDVVEAVKFTTSAIKDSITAVRTVTNALGGLRNALELIIALKFASKISTYGAALGGLVSNLSRVRNDAIGASGGLTNTTKSARQLAKDAKAAEARAIALRATLRKLAAIGVITIAIELFINRKGIEKSVDKFLDTHGLHDQLVSKIADTSKLNLANIDDVIQKAKNSNNSFIVGALEKFKAFLEAQAVRSSQLVATGLRDSFNETRSGARGAAAAAQAVAQAAATAGAGGGGGDTRHAKPLTAAQRNTFFDNDIARILLRGGLGSLRQQLAAINEASALVSARIKATKDVTRKQNLEDQLLQLQSQRRDVTKQIADGITQSNKDRLQALKDANDKRIAALTSKQFKELGLDATGNIPTPGVKSLKRRVSLIGAEIAGTTFDTPKLQNQLAAFRKVLSEGLVPKDVRAKIKELLDGIADELKNSGPRFTKFRKVSQDALLNGLGLDPATKRRIEQRLAGIGPSGTVPGGTSAAFASAGAKVPPINLYIDGKKVADNTSSHQNRASRNHASSRRGPYAGRH